MNETYTHIQQFPLALSLYKSGVVTITQYSTLKNRILAGIRLAVGQHFCGACGIFAGLGLALPVSKQIWQLMTQIR